MSHACFAQCYLFLVKALQYICVSICWGHLMKCGFSINRLHFDSCSPSSWRIGIYGLVTLAIKSIALISLQNRILDLYGYDPISCSLGMMTRLASSRYRFILRNSCCAPLLNFPIASSTSYLASLPMVLNHLLLGTAQSYWASYGIAGYLYLPAQTMGWRLI